jgi:hypothetical protein
MAYACPAWEFAAETHLLNCSACKTGFSALGIFPRNTSIQDMRAAFQVPYDYITKLCRRQVEINNHENENVRNIGQGETPHRKYKRLKLGGDYVYDR